MSMDARMGVKMEVAQELKVPTTQLHTPSINNKYSRPLSLPVSFTR